MLCKPECLYEVVNDYKECISDRIAPVWSASSLTFSSSLNWVAEQLVPLVEPRCVCTVWILWLRCVRTLMLGFQYPDQIDIKEYGVCFFSCGKEFMGMDVLCCKNIYVYLLLLEVGHIIWFDILSSIISDFCQGLRGKKCWCCVAHFVCCFCLFVVVCFNPFILFQYLLIFYLSQCIYHLAALCTILFL